MARHQVVNASADPTTVAHTTLGPVVGHTKHRALSFTGVRFGAPTGGANRFLPPKKPERWVEPKSALAPAPSAPQLVRAENFDPFYSWYSAVGQMDEDCLFLNVYTPALNDGRRRPVLVWIHGGGWREFSGNAPGFDGSRLAAEEDVIVVSINHRLGVFGFLSLPDDQPEFADSANAGLLDIVFALEWIAENAPNFGGDPNNVTVFGQSGGASKVVALASMPAAHGLFHKAFVQSSGGGLELARQDEAAKYARDFKCALGHEEWTGRDLQNLSTQQILDAYAKAPGAFRGTIDRRSLHSDPLAPVSVDKATPLGIPMLFGFTSTEATYYFRHYPDVFSIDRETAYPRLLQFLAIGEKGKAVVDRFFELYPALSPGDLLIRLTTDYQFTRNNVELALRQARNAPSSTFLYRFDYPSTIEDGRHGAPHTSELPYIFGTLEEAVGLIGVSPKHRDMSRIMMRCWAEFARHGNPNNVFVPEWQPFEASQLRMMVLDLVPRAEELNQKAAIEAFSGLPFAGYHNSRAALLEG
jgi:para-nitrobenzyl esterase